MTTQNKVDVIIIRGAPGTGKTQTAKSLCKFYPAGVKMEIDIIRQMVISVNGTNQDEHIQILSISLKMVNDFIKLGLNPIIIVDTFSGDKLQKYLTELYEHNSNLNIKIFGLFTSTEELERRLEKRISGEFKDVEICKNINYTTIKNKHVAESQIDTTGLLATETAEIIAESINNKLKIKT